MEILTIRFVVKGGDPGMEDLTPGMEAVASLNKKVCKCRSGNGGLNPGMGPYWIEPRIAYKTHAILTD